MKEEKETRFTLNGEEVIAYGEETVLDVAKREGVHIPALCHHESVSPYGSCRLCIVEAFWGKRSKLVTSCIYQPWEGDRIETDNQHVRRVRRTVLEMLLARCPEAEAIQVLAREYGIEEPRFQGASAPGPANCILCGLCVRVCDEVVGQSAIGYANRGTERYITPPYGEQAEECIGCGACVFVCPTGALHYEDVDGKRLMKELNASMPLVKCHVCGEYFATEKTIEKIRERLKLPEEAARTCPRCRGAEFADVLRKALLAAGTARRK